MLFVLSFLTMALLCTLTSALVVSVPLSPPATAPVLSSDLFSFSIEQDRWTSWSGFLPPNLFVHNALDNLKQLTGRPPSFRIGADSEDRTNFHPHLHLTHEDIFPPPTSVVPYPEASNITVGDKFYQAVVNLPAGTPVIWGVNFGQNNFTAAFLEVQSILKAFASSAVREKRISLEYIEIGNEADLYGPHGHRDPSTWNVNTYLAQWTDFAAKVYAALGLSVTVGPKLLAGSLAFSTATTRGFSPKALIANGLLTSSVGSFITTISQHHYSGSFCSGNSGLLSSLMNKTSIRNNLDYFTPDIMATRQQGLIYILGETNSYSCHGAPGVSNTAGAAIWALDYGLYAPQIGISRLHFHGGVGYKYNLIQPVTLNRSILDGSPLPEPVPPHVQPSYYAAVIAAEAIGSSGSTRAVELRVGDSEISGYGFYEGGALVRVVLINSASFFQGQTRRKKTNVRFIFDDRSAAPTAMTVKRLKIGHADDTSGVTWGGQTYETADARASGNVVVTRANVSAGVDIVATEVVMLEFSHSH